MQPSMSAARRSDVPAGPFEEGGEVGDVGVAAVVLPPGQLAADQGIDRRHLVGQVISRRAEVLLAQQPIGRTGQHGRHEAAARIDPVRIPREDAVADETYLANAIRYVLEGQ